MATLCLINGEALLTIGYTNFSHLTIVFIAKYLFTGSVKILNKIVFKIAITFISMRNKTKASCSFYLTPAHTTYSERRIILSGEMHGLS
jgi:hypothetical protein